MRVEELSQQDRKWIDAEAVGRDLGMSADDSRKLADLLADQGWVTILMVGESPKLRLVKRGFDEIATLRWPRWRRWLARNYSGVLAATAVVISLVALLSKVLFGW